jgi:hypothetical protein
LGANKELTVTAVKAKEGPMKRMYDEADVSESKELDWVGTLQQIVWRAAADGERLDSTGLAEALGAHLEIGERAAVALVAGMTELANYATASVETGDALTEESDAIIASRRAVRPLLEARLQQRIDDFESENRGAKGSSGQRLHSQGRRSRTRLTLLGEVMTKRRWYVDPEQGGFSPAEREVGLPADDFSARLAEVVTMMATTVSEEMATTILGWMMGVEISKHGLQGLVHERGQFAMNENDSTAESYDPFEESGLMREVKRPDDATADAPSVGYLEIDGVVPVTRELDKTRSTPVEGARGGKGLRYTLVGREVKNAVLYRGDKCTQLMPSRGSLLDKTYVSRLGNWSPFALSVWTEMRRLRFDEADTIVLLSDGAKWIRTLAEWLPCEVFLILDLFHAKHRIWEVSKALWGDRTAQTRRWARRQCNRVEEGHVDKVLKTLERLQQKHNVEKLDELHTYFTNNQDRMNYPAYRAANYRVTTAGVESANYHVTGARLKQQGMRWSREGASEMATLRADLFNGRWRQRTRAMLKAVA